MPLTRVISGVKRLPFLRPYYCFRLAAQGPSMVEFRLHLQKPKYFAWFLTGQNHQPEPSIHKKLYRKYTIIDPIGLFFIQLEFTLQIGLWGSFKFTSKLSHFKSKCTIFFECRYSIPNAASIAMRSLLWRSRYLKDKI